MKHRTSLQSRLLAYLRSNPNAELSRQDIMDLFHAGVKHVDDTLTTMRREGLVETVHVTRLQAQDRVGSALQALELIATPMRPDGTWNRDREACRILAAKALLCLTRPGGARE
jgi:hypothetical protein